MDFAVTEVAFDVDSDDELALDPGYLRQGDEVSVMSQSTVMHGDSNHQGNALTKPISQLEQEFADSQGPRIWDKINTVIDTVLDPHMRLLKGQEEDDEEDCEDSAEFLPGGCHDEKRKHVSERCRRLEENIVKIKLELAQAKSEEEAEEFRSRRLSDEIAQMKEEINETDDSGSKMSNDISSLTIQVNELKSQEASLDVRVEEAWSVANKRAEERDAVKAFIYEHTAGYAKEKMNEIKTWVVNDLSQETMVA